MEVELPQDVYPLMCDMRRAFEQIMDILQQDERRIRNGYELLQRERDAMGRELLSWHQTRGEAPWENATEKPWTSPVRERDAPLAHTMDTPQERQGSSQDGSFQRSYGGDSPRGGTGDRTMRGQSTNDEDYAGGGTEVSLKHDLHPCDTPAEREDTFMSSRDSASPSPLRSTERAENRPEFSRRSTLTPADRMLSPSIGIKEDHSPTRNRLKDTDGLFTASAQERCHDLVSPTRGNDRLNSFVSPPCDDDSLCAPMVDNINLDEDAPVTQLDLRLYATSVGPKAYTDRGVVQRDVVHKCDATHPMQLLPRRTTYKDATDDGTTSGCDTLAESDHTTTLTTSSYERRNPNVLRALQVCKRENAVTTPGPPSETKASAWTVGFQRTQSYAAKHRALHAKDASTATCYGGLHRNALYLDNTARTNTEASHGFWVKVWPCFGSHSTTATPVKVYVYGHYRHLEDVTERAAELLKCKPAPPYMFEPDGSVVRRLAQLVPDQNYLLFPSGGFYREEAVPSALLREMVTAARQALVERSF